MPRIVNHQDRVDCIREAVTVIAVREGVGAVDLERIAAELRLSTSTLRRFVRSPEVLPQLGLEWVERHRRQRRFRVAGLRRTAGASWEHARRCLEAELPLDERGAEEERAWWAVARGASTPAALEMVRDQEEYVATCVRRVVELGAVTGVDPAAVTLSLRASVTGLALGVARGWVTPAEVRVELDRLLLPLTPHPDLMAPPSLSGTFAVASSVNDR